MPKPIVERHVVASLPAPIWDDAWALATRYNAGTRAAFEASVRAKKYLVTIRDPETRVLIGMGTIDVYPFEERPARDGHKAKRCIVIYTGNAIFEPAVRGFSIIQRIGFRCYLEARVKHPLTPVWLFYDTFSFKSYLMLANNFDVFWPRWDQPTPARVADFIDRLGQHRYGTAWDASRGLCQRGERKLLDGVADITPELLANAHIRYFRERNPGAQDGDMLAVVAPLRASNWLAVLRRARQRKQRGPEERGRG